MAARGESVQIDSTCHFGCVELDFVIPCLPLPLNKRRHLLPSVLKTVSVTCELFGARSESWSKG